MAIFVELLNYVHTIKPSHTSSLLHLLTLNIEVVSAIISIMHAIFVLINILSVI